MYPEIRKILLSSTPNPNTVSGRLEFMTRAGVLSPPYFWGKLRKHAPKKKFTHQMEFNQNMCRWFLKDKIKIWKSFCSNLKKIRAFVLVLNLHVCVTSPVLRNWERGLWYCSLKSLLRIRKVRKYFKNIIIWRMILNPQNVWSILWKSIILKPKLPRINKTNLEVETKFSTKLLYLYISKIQNYT